MPLEHCPRRDGPTSESAYDSRAMLHVILYQPEIPPNTGNLIRLCANAGAMLHLVHPLGFDVSDAQVRRAGLDYHEMANVREHPNLPACLASLGTARVFALTTRATRSLYDAAFRAGDAFLFGPETRGLPQELLDKVAPEMRLKIPMRAGNRSLNLSNAAAVTVYEAWRQLGFDGCG
jgi:tRNA (cytidine/uridine-2'-O-)-methyltransferase